MTSNLQIGPKDGDEVVNSPLEKEAHGNLKTALEDLILREAKLRQIVGMLFDGILIVQDSVIVETNHGLLSMTGYDFGAGGSQNRRTRGWKDLGILWQPFPKPVSFESCCLERALVPCMRQ
jgi:hypothetical protein